MNDDPLMPGRIGPPTADEETNAMIAEMRADDEARRRGEPPAQPESVTTTADYCPECGNLQVPPDHKLTCSRHWKQAAVATASEPGEPPPESLEDIAAEHVALWLSGASVPIRRKEVQRILVERVALRARVEELTALVESAYQEGWVKGPGVDVTNFTADMKLGRCLDDWLNSDARKALLASAERKATT